MAVDPQPSVVRGRGSGGRAGAWFVLRRLSLLASSGRRSSSGRSGRYADVLVGAGRLLRAPCAPAGFRTGRARVLARNAQPRRLRRGPAAPARRRRRPQSARRLAHIGRPAPRSESRARRADDAWASAPRSGTDMGSCGASRANAKSPDFPRLLAGNPAFRLGTALGKKWGAREPVGARIDTSNQARRARLSTSPVAAEGMRTATIYAVSAVSRSANCAFEILPVGVMGNASTTFTVRRERS